jgi:hypothetical protein
MDDISVRIAKRLNGSVLEPNDHTKHIDEMIALSLKKIELLKDLKVAVLAAKSQKKYVSLFEVKDKPIIIEHDEQYPNYNPFMDQFSRRTWRTKKTE